MKPWPRGNKCERRQPERDIWYSTMISVVEMSDNYYYQTKRDHGPVTRPPGDPHRPIDQRRLRTLHANG